MEGEMKLLRAKVRRAFILGGTELVDIALNLEHVQSIEYKPAQTVESRDEELGTMNLEARLELHFAAAEPVTLHADEADRVWKIIESYFEH